MRVAVAWGGGPVYEEEARVPEIESQEEMRIGILGGTFNPIHMGHLILGQTAIEAFGLTKVLFIPCHTPSHKNASSLLDARHRLEMVKLAVEDNWCFEPCDIEIQRGGVSYAVDTVAELRQRYPDARLFFIIGADSLVELHLWRNIYCLLTLCDFVTFARPGLEPENLTAQRLCLDDPWPARLLENLTIGPLIDISSSDVRHRLAEGLSIRYLVPAPVAMYIAEHHVYDT